MASPISYIAEFACIHEGDGDYLLELASAMKAAGATGVKFQIFSADEVVAPGHPDHDYLKSISFIQEEWATHINACADIGLDVWVDVSGSFSLAVVSANIDQITGVKVHSADIDNPIVLDGIKQLGKPVAIGTGGTPLIDLFELLDRLGPSIPVTLLHGYQAFPKLEGAPGGPPVKGVGAADLELWRIRQLVETFPNARIGLSDHLAGDDPLAVTAPALAISLGATVIEKHATLVRAELREDYFSSIEPSAFADMVRHGDAAAIAVGTNLRRMGEGELGYRREMKRAPFATQALALSDKLSTGNLEYVRDGSYESSARAGRIIDRSVQRPIEQGIRLTDAAIDMKVGIFCNARYGSSRLPGKALLPFYDGMPTIGYLLKRLTSYPGDIGQVVFATTHLDEDDALAEVARGVNVPVVRGPVLDVMGRMLVAADEHGWDTLVRVTGDDELVSCEYIERAIAYHLGHSLDFTRVEGLPIGMGCEVIDVRTLRRIHQAIPNHEQTELLTWFLDSQWTCRTGAIEADAAHAHSEFRITLDYQEDYDLMRAVAARCHASQPGFYITTDQIVQALIEIDPAWREQADLWANVRSEVETGLVYSYEPPPNR
jgi:spore coat polysaccharide biosynthesis protein SpsF (cytidylyltransferase family)/sialic acid synthase SpsE